MQFRDEVDIHALFPQVPLSWNFIRVTVTIPVAVDVGFVSWSPVCRGSVKADGVQHVQ